MHLRRDKPDLRQLVMAYSLGGLRLPLCMAIAFSAIAGLHCTRDHQLPVTVSDRVARVALNRTASISYSGSPRLVGTAMILDSRLITNHHVIEGREDRIRVTVDGARFFEARVIKKDPALDLALLQIESDDFSPETDAALVALAEPSAGMQIFSYGAAFGLHESYFQGYISHPARTEILGGQDQMALVQIQGVTFPGMSGAPIFTLDGEFVGMNRAAYGYAADTGTGLAIPGEIVLEFSR